MSRNLPISVRITALVFFAVIFCSELWAQQTGLRMIPLGNNPTIVRHLEQHSVHSRNNQTCSVDTVSLPFFDDFANNPNGFYPDCAKWQDNHVFVNNDMAYKPPSVGVATFDGLKGDGTPYNQNAGPSTGWPADTMTSQHIDLSGLQANDNVYLSFFLQRQGLSDRPEDIDSFFVEFKDTSDQWVMVADYVGVDDSVSVLEIPLFEQQYIKIEDTRFLYDGFQFRFRNLAAVSGNNDHWHVDYVYLEQNRNNADTSNINYGRYADVAFTHVPSTPLKEGLTAVPWRHFIDSSMFADTMLIRNYNHKQCNAGGAVTLDRGYQVNEVSPNTTSLINMPIPTVPSYTCSPNAEDSLVYATTTWNNLSPTEKTTLESTYYFTSVLSQNNAIALKNDTVKRQTVLDNYFAYDDGTAETRVIAQNIGTKIAVEFKAEVADTIRGVYFHLPYFRNRNAEIDFINVKVWLDSLSNEVYSRDFYKLRYEEGFNGFHFVLLQDFTGLETPVPLLAGQTFYVGWQQASFEEVPVGFDRSADASEKTWISVGSSWQQSEISGCVMIRPLLSPDSTYSLIPVKEIETATPTLRVYPNPTTDKIQIAIEGQDINPWDYQLTLNNIPGQAVYNGEWTNQLDMSDYESGLYILSLKDADGRLLTQQKIIKHNR